MRRQFSFSRIVLLLNALLFLLVIVWSVRVGLIHVASDRTLFAIVPGLMAAFCVAAAVVLPSDWRAVAATTFLVTVACLLAAETYFQWQSYTRAVVSRSAGDAEQNQVLANIRDHRDTLTANGDRAYPQLCPSSFVGDGRMIALDGVDVLPLGGISDNNVIHPVSGNGFSIGKTDRYGFNNPNDVWDVATGQGIMFVGDSFTYGADLPFGESFVDMVRGDGFPVFNLGCGGNGPLANLAALREYGPLKLPRLVVWVHFEGNDLPKDFAQELGAPILRNYLGRGASALQDLAGKQPRVDREMMAFVDRVLAAAAIGKGGAPERGFMPNWRNLLTLTTLRTRLGLTVHFDPSLVPEFDRVIGLANETVEGWGGRLIFAYLPSETRFLNRIANWHADGYRRIVQDVVEGHGIAFIDLAEAFGDVTRPRELFHGHLSPAGARLVADRLEPVLNDMK